MIARVLFTGGARSGKSAAAERLASQADHVTYVATAPRYPNDPEWVNRIRSHRSRRPDHWTTIETSDIATEIRRADPGNPVLVDCLTLWLTSRLDDHGAWQNPASALPLLHQEIDELTDAVRCAQGGVVLVTNEVGMGIVPGTPAGRLFQDLLGKCNGAVAAECDEVYLVVVGRLLPLGGDPRSGELLSGHPT